MSRAALERVLGHLETFRDSFPDPSPYSEATEHAINLVRDELLADQRSTVVSIILDSFALRSTQTSWHTLAEDASDALIDAGLIASTAGQPCAHRRVQRRISGELRCHDCRKVVGWMHNEDIPKIRVTNYGRSDDA